MEMIIAFSIICTLLLGCWIWFVDGWYSKPQKSTVRAIPCPVKSSFPWCQHSVINPPIQKFVPVLSVIYEDIDGENAENMSSVAAIEMDKAEDTETAPEVLMPEPLSQPDPETAIDNNKIMDCIHQSWKPDLLLAETDDDSDDEFIIPPDFFVDPNQTDPEIVPEVLMPLSHSQQTDAEAVIAAIPDQKITADATHQLGIETLIETDERATEPDLLEVAGDSIKCETDKNLDETLDIPTHETDKIETMPLLNNPEDEIVNQKKTFDEIADLPRHNDALQLAESDDSNAEVIPPHLDVKVKDSNEPTEGPVQQTIEQQQPPVMNDIQQEHVTENAGEDSIKPETNHWEEPETDHFKEIVIDSYQNKILTPKINTLVFDKPPSTSKDDRYYLSVRIDERQNNKIIKTTKMSTRDLNCNLKSLVFDVHTAEDATVTCKLKKTTFGGLKKITLQKKTIREALVMSSFNRNTGNKPVPMLPDFTVEVKIGPSAVKEKKNEVLLNRKEPKLKEKLATKRK
jgi:hypothetical protein